MGTCQTASSLQSSDATRQASTELGAMMKCVAVKPAQKANPTGDPNFTVMQPFPAAISPEDADPFLMCDEFGPEVSKGLIEDPDKFSVGWHPHIGMDIMTYLTEGTGRHADSMGNRSEFQAPGFQWCSVGSGIEHAEGGGTPAGARQHGFQIWINVPQNRKKDDPRYGTEPPENIPVLKYPGVQARLLAGQLGEAHGPFKTVQEVLMVDLELDVGTVHEYSLPESLDSCMIYIYRGDGKVAGEQVPWRAVAQLDAAGPARQLLLEAGPQGMAALLFAGRRIREKIVWHGPFVMSSQTELRSAFVAYQSGNFPPKRVPWDYKRASAAPPGAQGA